MGRGTIKSTSSEQDDTLNYYNIIKVDSTDANDQATMAQIEANGTEDLIPYITQPPEALPLGSCSFQILAYNQLQGNQKAKVDSLKYKNNWPETVGGDQPVTVNHPINWNFVVFNPTT